MSQFYTCTDGSKLAYNVFGTGSNIIVLLHGWGGNQLSFLPALEHIDKTKYTVVTYDQRGFGESTTGTDSVTLVKMASDLHEMLVFLNLADVFVCGWSMGGLVVMQYYRDFGKDRIARLGIVDVTPRATVDPVRELGFYNNRYTAKNALEDLALMCENFDGFAESLVTNGNLELFTDEMKAAFIQKVILQNQGRLTTLMCMWLEACTCDFTEDYGKLDLPVLFFHGGTSAFCSAKARDYVMSELKQGTLAEFSECSHYLPIERAQRFAEELCSFAGGQS